MKNYPSPNFDARSSAIDTIVLHYTDTKTCQEALDILTNPERKVSAHYVVSETGEIYSLVAEEMRAWHAGTSFWKGKDSINSNSIGIEIFNPGHLNGYKEFPKAQMQAVLELCQQIMERHKIAEVVAHSDIAPDRKKDPGELFDWQFLSENGVGIWHSVKSAENREIILKKGDSGTEAHDLQNRLNKFGYKIKINGLITDDTVRVIEAFQRRFMPLPRIVDGNWGNVEDRILDELLA